MASGRHPRSSPRPSIGTRRARRLAARSSMEPPGCGVAAAGVIAAVAGFAHLDRDVRPPVSTSTPSSKHRSCSPRAARSGRASPYRRSGRASTGSATGKSRTRRRSPGSSAARPDAGRSTFEPARTRRGPRCASVWTCGVPGSSRSTGAVGDADCPARSSSPSCSPGVGETGLERRRPLALADMSRFIPAAVLAAEDHRFFDHWRHGSRGRGSRARRERLPRRDRAGGQHADPAARRRTSPWDRSEPGAGRSARACWPWRSSAATRRRRSSRPISTPSTLASTAGRRVLGVGAAAQSYLGKDARRLSARRERAPGRHDPGAQSLLAGRAPERAQGRRDAVLRRMHELGLIDGQTLEAALAERTRRARRQRASVAGAVLPRLRARGDRHARRGAESPRIYTTLDPGLQRAAETAVARGLDRLESAHRRPPPLAVRGADSGRPGRPGSRPRARFEPWWGGGTTSCPRSIA